MELDKKYRHASNPKEKEFHDEFIKQLCIDDYSYIAFPTTDGATLVEHVTEREKQIMIKTKQWLGSPVGRTFLLMCEYVPVTYK